MKKIFTVLIALILTLTLGVTALATDTDIESAPEVTESTDISDEIGTEAEISPDTSISADEGAIPLPDSENAELEADSDSPEAFYTEWIDKITDSTMWVNIGTSLLSLLGILAFVKSKFGSLFELIGGKADGGEVKSALTSSAKEIKEAFASEFASVNKKLDAYEDNEKKLWAILTIFMTHARISSAAKSEIMELLAGIKDMSGSVTEIVEKARRAIEEAEAEAAVAVPAHPALDAVLAKSTQSSDYMEL